MRGITIPTRIDYIFNKITTHYFIFSLNLFLRNIKEK
jgi:hypothetical protein